MCGMMIGGDGGDDRPEVLLFFFASLASGTERKNPANGYKCGASETRTASLISVS